MPKIHMSCFEPDPYEPCPCGKPAKYKFCCKGKAGWLKSPVVLREPMGSGAAPTQCYATHHGNCAGKISKEHFLSHCVLREFGATVKVSGFYWIPAGQSKSLTTAGLGTNILCQGHNSALSPLDDEARKFFRTALDFAEAGSRNATESDFRLFAGENVERYLLKVMIGAVSSASLAASGQQIRLNQASYGHQVLVDLLFGRLPIPDGMGVYVLANGNQRQAVHRHIEARILIDANDDKAIVGMYVNIFGLPLAFLLGPPTGPTPLFTDAIYRPGSIAFHEPNGAVRHIQLCWEGQGDRDGGHLRDARRDPALTEPGFRSREIRGKKLGTARS